MATPIASLLPSVKADFSRAGTYIKTVAVAVLGGAVGAVGDALSNNSDPTSLFTHAGFLQMKHTFLYGATVAVIGLFIRSPMKTTISTAVRTGFLPPPPAVTAPAAASLTEGK
jgi:hypothetical protein